MPVKLRPAPWARGRHDLAIPVAAVGMAIALGAAISLLPRETVVRGMIVATGATVVVGLGVSAAPGALTRVRILGARLQWWHWLWLLVFLSGLVFRIRDIDAARETALDPWAAWRVGLMGSVAVLLLSRLPRRRPNWLPVLLRGVPAGLVLYGLTSVLSTLWSVYPAWTLYKSVEYLIDVALLVGILAAVRTVEEVKSLLDWSWLLYGLLLLTVWIGVLVRPDLALLRGVGLIGIQIQGVMPAVAANGVGDLSALLFVVTSARLLSRRRDKSLYRLLWLAAVPTLVFAQSRSPATGALLGVFAVLLLERRFGLLVAVGAGIAALTALTSGGTVVQQAFLRGQDPALFYSLSGRVGWWTAGWDFLRQHLLLGLGGYAGARFAVLGTLGVTESSTIHNTWLEILLGVGLIGLAPFLFTFAGTWLNLLRPLDARTQSLAREVRAEAVGVFVLMCFRSVFSDEFIWHPPLTFLAVLACAELLRRARHDGIGAPRSAPAVWRRPERIPPRGVPAG